VISQKVKAGSEMPKLSLPRAGGGVVKLGDSTHCRSLLSIAASTVRLSNLSEDPGRTARAVQPSQRRGHCNIRRSQGKSRIRDCRGKLAPPVGYDLRPDQMRQLGLYISEPRSPQETDRPFAEPGLFIINPQGRIQVVDISNAPFARPELGGVLKGLKFIQEKQYPIRGTLA
jgi:hypothetical protein